MSDRRYENAVQIIGIVNNKEFDADRGRAGAGRIGIRAGDNMVYLQMWEKTDGEGNPIGVVESFIKNEVFENEYIEAGGELNEWESEGEYRRQVVNRMIGQNEVYNIDMLEIEDTEEFAIVRFSGDVLNSDMDLTNVVHGEEVDTETPKLELELVTINLYNPDSGEEDLSRKNVLIDAIESNIDYQQGQDNPNEKAIRALKKMKGKLSDSESPNVFYDTLQDFIDSPANSYKINNFHLVAYDNLAEEIYNDVNKGDNITVGCDILNTQIRDRYGIPQGNLNEVEIKSYAGINETGSIAPDAGQDDDFDW